MFEGIITPIVTPFHRDTEESLNIDAMKNLVDHLIDKGVSGIFPLGSNGEFHVINNEEKMQFTKEVITHVNKRVPVYVGTGACSTKETIELSKKAEELGADVLSVITPYFIRPSEDELITHYTSVAESVKLPILLYNIPKNTRINISKRVLKELAKIDNIQGIKDSSGDIDNLAGYIEIAKGTQLKVLVGSDSKILAGYQLGATGAIAGTSNLITEILVGLDAAYRAGDLSKAEQLQQEIEELRSVLKLGTVPVILKRSVELAGIAEVGPARGPVREPNSETDQRIKAMLSYYQI
ncbi:dihydrodipicolinate synthase family protein [Candidatus Enterococcus ferrettii]|uniref:Dihydrodipicolinate synthase n=1 Tax=Candidatus Enterococcus ferrettii TaxID=2815324 RepID=A0ABV0ELU1_9ENTE|nr:dihydrodipicolinate synthase family protein [Enterococcus sp. 665A]